MGVHLEIDHAITEEQHDMVDHPLSLLDQPKLFSVLSATTLIHLELSCETL
jgi:hypothetical protein